MEYVALDLETTGLDPERDRVIEVGAVAFTPARVLASMERLTNPGRAVPDAVLRLTGIRPDELVSAPEPGEALGELGGLLAGRQPVGHGARLDVDFLVASGHWPDGREMLDTLDLARILMPSASSHSLPTLAARLGLDQPRPHRALDDADATRQLLLHLRQLAGQLPGRLQEAMLSLVAPYDWPVASFFADALTAENLPRAVEGAPRDAGMEGTPAAESGGSGTPAADDDPNYLASLLRPEGPLAASMPDYEHREPQVQMLLAVAQIMRRGGRLVCEAGTGTGKTLAYLLPAAARSVSRGERVVVATHTLTLQEQLVQKDLPDLRRWLPWHFDAALLKGRANYLSLRRWRHYLAEPCRDSEELKFKLKVLVWLQETETGDRAELRLHGGAEEGFWARVASGPLDCAGLRCSDADCFVHRARGRAERAGVVVVNHALLLADRATGGSLIPPYEHLVVDEAHHLEESATQSLRREVDANGLEALLRRLVTEGDELATARTAIDTASTRCADLFRGVAAWVRASVSPDEPQRREEAVRVLPAHREAEEWPALASQASDAVTALTAVDTEVRRVVAESRDGLGGDQPDQRLRELEIVRGSLAEAAELIEQSINSPDPEQVYWCGLVGRNGTPTLRAAPIEVGQLLRNEVFGDLSSLVLTSASLAVGGSFDYFCSRTGLGPEVETLLLASPFDYLHQALMCLPTDMPDPQLPEFEVAVEEIVAELASHLGGRVLALFTSHQMLRNVYAGLKHRSDLDEVLILGQGIDGQRRSLLRAFEEAERPLLLGTASFWEGVDVPGDQLSCVVIVRLPFAVPTEPVFAARAERLRDPFRQYALPMAALRLKQGFGRLIRRRDDRGAVVILDNRVLVRDYGRAFLDALPPAPRYLGPAAEVGAHVEAWIAGRAVAYLPLAQVEETY